jgi:excisionase family DNA binding protein
VTEPGSDRLTTPEAAKRAGVSERTITKWVQGGKVGTHDGPRGRLIDRASLDAWRIERARRAGATIRTSSAPGPTPDPELLTELLTEVRALRAELAALRSERLTLTAPQPDPVTEAPSEPGAEPGPTGGRGLWARLGRWWKGGSATISRTKE